MRRVEWHLLLGAAALALAASPASACTVSTVAVAFGAYNPRTATADDGTGTITLACATTVTAPVVAIGGGGSGLVAARRMTSGATILNYGLYTTTTRNIIWGNGTSGTVTVTLTGGTISGGQRRFSRTVYGRIPALQNVRAGTYGDTVVVTVTF